MSGSDSSSDRATTVMTVKGGRVAAAANVALFVLEKYILKSYRIQKNIYINMCICVCVYIYIYIYKHMFVFVCIPV